MFKKDVLCSNFVFLPEFDLLLGMMLLHRDKLELMKVGKDMQKKSKYLLKVPRNFKRNLPLFACLRPIATPKFKRDMFVYKLNRRISLSQS